MLFHLDNVLVDIFDGPRRIKFTDAGVLYIRLGDIDEGEIYLDPNQSIGPVDLDNRFYLRSDDVLLTKTGDEPRAAVVHAEAVGALIAPDIYCLRVSPDKLSPIWLAYFLNSNYGKARLSERSSGATIRRLRLDDVRSMPIISPPASLVREIEDLEQQAQQHSQVAQQIWAAITKGMYAEIDEHIQRDSSSMEVSVKAYLNNLESHNLFRPLYSVARIAISSRKTLKPDQIVRYVQASDIDPRSFLFRRVRSALAQDLPRRIRLPLRAYQVVLLASGSNLGTPNQPVAVVDDKLDGGFASNAFLAIEFDETPIYYGIALKHPFVLEQIREIAAGTVVSTLRKKEVVNLRIPVLGAVWRQDFNDRAQLAWERRTLALSLRHQAMDKVEAFIQHAGAEESE